MGTLQIWVLLAFLGDISSLPGPVSMGLEDMAVEMALCEQLAVCNFFTEDDLEPVVRKLERAIETNELDFGDNLDDEAIEKRVGRLLCGLSYNDFCTTEVLGRADLGKENALCILEGINCKSMERTGLTGLIATKKKFVETVLNGEEETTTTTASTTSAKTDEKESMQDSEEKGVLNTLTDKVLNAKMTVIKAGLNVKAGALSAAAKAFNVKAGALSVAAKAIDGFANALGVQEGTTTTTTTPTTTTAKTDEKENMEDSEEKGLLNTLTDKVLNAKMNVLKAGFNVKAGALSVAAKAIGGLANAIAGLKGSNNAAEEAIAEEELMVDETVADADEGSGDEGSGVEGSGDEGSGDTMGKSFIKAKTDVVKAVIGAAAKAVGGVTDVVVGGIAAKINATKDIFTATADLGTSVFNSKIAVFNSVFDTAKDFAEEKGSVVNSAVNKLSEISNETVNAKIALAKASAKVAAIAAEGTVNLTQSALNGVFDVKLAAINATSAIATAVVKTKASLFNSFFHHLKYKINIVLCKLKVKCSESKTDEETKKGKAVNDEENAADDEDANAETA